jgi:hypothetical protein
MNETERPNAIWKNEGGKRYIKQVPRCHGVMTIRRDILPPTVVFACGSCERQVNAADIPWQEITG